MYRQKLDSVASHINNLSHFMFVMKSYLFQRLYSNETGGSSTASWVCFILDNLQKKSEEETIMSSKRLNVEIYKRYIYIFFDSFCYHPQ